MKLGAGKQHVHDTLWQLHTLCRYEHGHVKAHTYVLDEPRQRRDVALPRAVVAREASHKGLHIGLPRQNRVQSVRQVEAGRRVALPQGSEDGRSGIAVVRVQALRRRASLGRVGRLRVAAQVRGVGDEAADVPRRGVDADGLQPGACSSWMCDACTRQSQATRETRAHTSGMETARRCSATWRLSSSRPVM